MVELGQHSQRAMLPEMKLWCRW